MIRTKNTYVDINGIVLNKKTYYLVIYTIVYEISIFGKVIKEFKRYKELPFVFESIEIAKDFCELKPKYKKFKFKRHTPFHDIYYQTYKLTLNNKVNAYIIWNTAYLLISNEDAYYKPNESYPIIFSFINDYEYDVILPNYHEAQTAKHINVKNDYKKLSDIFCISKTDKHHFELIEQ